MPSDDTVNTQQPSSQIEVEYVEIDSDNDTEDLRIAANCSNG